MWPILLKLGPLKIPGYGFMLGVAILVGIWLAKREARRKDVDPQAVESLAFWVALMSVLGARFAFIFIEHGDEYWPRPWEFFYFQRGGLTFSGSLVAAIATIWIFAWKNRLSAWKLLDILTPSVALGLMFGKLGCLLAGCCYGRICDFPWAVTFHKPEALAEPKGVPLQPTQLYEASAWFLLFWLIFWFRRRDLKPGETFLFFGVVYGTARFFFEYLRADPGMMGPLTTAQALSIPLVAVSAFLWWKIRRGAR